MRKFLAIAICLLCSCSPKLTKKYAVVSSFGNVIEEVDDKEKAFEKAKDLTYFGRVFPSKPMYFVIEK